MQFVTLRKTQHLIDRLANNEAPKVTEFGIGIGTSVTDTSTSLSQEVYRGTVIAKGKKLIDGTPYMHVAGFIPPQVANIAISEVGLYDESGKLLYYAVIDPPIVISQHDYTARIIHMMIVYDDQAAALVFESGLTSLVEHNRDPNCHPDIREQLTTLEARLLPDDLYSDIFAAMAGLPVANALVVIEYDPTSLQETNQAYWRPLLIRHTLSPYSTILIKNEYDLNKSKLYPVRQLIQTKYFVIERQTQMFDPSGMPTHVVYNLTTPPITTLNSELRKIIAALGYPPVNFSMTIVYDDITHLPKLITYTGDLNGIISLAYDANQMLSKIDVSLLNNQVNFSATFNVTLDQQGNPANIEVIIDPALTYLVKTPSPVLYGAAMLVSSLLNEFALWTRLGITEYRYTAKLVDNNVEHTLIVNGLNAKPAVYNYWALNTDDNTVLRGYALASDIILGTTIAIQQIQLLA